MHHLPQPKDQARIFKAALKNLNLEVKHQDALEVLAKIGGFKDWQTMSAMPPSAATGPEKEALSSPAIIGPDDGDLYEALVTVDVSMTARIRVRAHSKDKAEELFSLAGVHQFPGEFELDEGNHHGVGDFYLGDSVAVQNLSEPIIEGSNASASAKWRDEAYEYRVEMSRDEPDCSDDERRANVTVTLVVSAGPTLSCNRTLRDYQVHDDLRGWLRDCVAEGDFTEDLEKLAARLTRKVKK